jgi:hypothetical protein
MHTSFFHQLTNAQCNMLLALRCFFAGGLSAPFDSAASGCGRYRILHKRNTHHRSN